MGFTSFGLSDQIMKGVRAAGHTIPTPIQALAIHPAMAGKDIVASAQTGTGKTAAFVLPLLHRLATGDTPGVKGRYPRALVLTPTRELAQQVQGAVATYGRYLPLRGVAIYGGAGMSAQTASLRHGVDIIAATPGRLLDHLQQRTVDLSRIQVLVLDEADRMLDMGFIRDVTKIIERIPRERQTLLFSATLSAEITKLAARFLREPETFEAGKQENPADGITQYFYEVPREGKLTLLFHALGTEKMESVLVFSRTKHGADKICRKLEGGGIAAVAIHSNRTQGQRERALEGFKQGDFRVLVATDIAARGIDVSGISHVINYDVPQYAEDYIHRIGRTGRAGSVGDAITFVSAEERQYLKRIEQFLGKQLPLNPYPGAPKDFAKSTGHSERPARAEHPRHGAHPHTANRQQAKEKSHPSGFSRKKRSPLKEGATHTSRHERKGWSNH